MSGGDPGGSKGFRLSKKGIPFYLMIAHHAGIRRTSIEVFVHEIPNDGLAEVLPQVDDKVGRANLVADGPRIVDPF